MIFHFSCLQISQKHLYTKLTIPLSMALTAHLIQRQNNKNFLILTNRPSYSCTGRAMEQQTSAQSKNWFFLKKVFPLPTESQNYAINSALFTLQIWQYKPALKLAPSAAYRQNHENTPKQHHSMPRAKRSIWSENHSSLASNWIWKSYSSSLTAIKSSPSSRYFKDRQEWISSRI